MSTLQALRRLAQNAAPRLTRGLQSGRVAKAQHEVVEVNHNKVVFGDGHHGLRPGYNYDWEHGPHYIDFSKISNWKLKFHLFTKGAYVVGMGIPIFLVVYQQNKMKG